MKELTIQLERGCVGEGNKAESTLLETFLV